MIVVGAERRPDRSVNVVYGFLSTSKIVIAPVLYRGGLTRDALSGFEKIVNMVYRKGQPGPE